MGTHPIFESDFDCLTECDELRIFVQVHYYRGHGRGKIVSPAAIY